MADHMDEPPQKRIKRESYQQGPSDTGKHFYFQYSLFKTFFKKLHRFPI